MANDNVDGSLSFKASIFVEADKLLHSFREIKRIAASAFKDMQQSASRAYARMDKDLERSRIEVGTLQEKLEKQAELLERLRSGKGGGKYKAFAGREAIKLAEEEYKKLAEQLSQAEQMMQQYGQRIHAVENRSQMSIENSTKKLDSMIAKYRELLIRKNELNAQGFTTGDARYDRTVNQLAKLGDAIERYKQKLRSAGSEEKNAEGNTNVFHRALLRLQDALRGIASDFRLAFSAANTKLIHAAKSATSKLANHLKSKLNPSFKGTERTLKKLTRTFIKYVFGVRSFFFLYRKIRKAVSEGLGSLALVDDRTNQSISNFKTALNTLRGALTGAFAPIINVVAPILTMFCNMLSEAINYLGMFIAYLTGQKTYYKAVSAQQDYAASLQDTADAANNAHEATKEYLSGLDEIRKWDDGSGSGAGSGGGGGGGTDPTQGLQWEEVEIPDSIKNLADTIKDYFENQDWDGLGAFMAEKINTAFQKLYDIINWENVGPKITPVIEGITQTFNSLVDNVDWDLIGRTVGAGVNTVVNSIDLLLTGIDWTNLGSKLSEGVSGLLSEVDWKNVGKTIADSFNTIIDAADGFITTFTKNNGWKTAGQSIADTVNGLVDNIHWDTIGKDIGNGIKGLLTTLYTAIEGIDWIKLGQSVATAIKNVDWTGVADAFFETLGAALGALSGFIIGLFSDAFSALVTWFNTNAFNEEGKIDPLKLLNALWGEFKNIAKWAKEHILDPIIDGIAKTLDMDPQEFKDTAKDIGLGILNGIASAFTSLYTWVKENILDPIVNGIKNIFGISSPAKNEDILSAGKNIGLGILNGIASAFTNIATWVKTNILDPIANAIGGAIEVGVSLVQEGWTTLTGWLKGFGDWTKEKISQGVELVKEGWDKVSDWISEKKENFGEVVEKGVNLVKEGWDKVQTWAEKPENSGNVIAKGVQLAQEGWNTVKGWVEDAKQSGGVAESLVNLAANGWGTFKRWLTGNDEGNVEINIQYERPDKSDLEPVTDVYDLTGEGALAEKQATVKVQLEWAEKEASIDKWVQNYGGGSDTVKEKIALHWNEKNADNIKDWVQTYGDGSDTVEEKIALKQGKELSDYKAPKYWVKSLDGKTSQITEGVKLKRDGNLATYKNPKTYTKALDGKKSGVTEGVDVYQTGALKTYGNAANYVKRGIGTVTVGVDLVAQNVDAFTKKVFDLAKSTLNRAVEVPYAQGGILPFASGGLIKNWKGVLSAVPHYASGTVRPHGTMFVAGEAGPEIIGHINGQTEILNKSQIAAAIYSAVTVGIGDVLSRFASLLFAHMNANTYNVINALANRALLSSASIPNIATGSSLPANRAFLSSEGGQLGGISETGLRQLIREEVSRGNAQYEFIAQLNRRTIFDEVISEAKLRQIQTGKNPFEFA